MKGIFSFIFFWFDILFNYYYRRFMCIYIVDGEYMIGFIIFIVL